MSLRPLAEADIPQVTELFWHYMRRREGPAPASLLSIFHDLYFKSPFVDSAVRSFVFEGPTGDIVGFLGGVVRRMSVCDRSIRVTYGSNLVMHPEFRSGVAAPHMVATFLALDYDLTMTDSANNISRKILERNGLRVIPALNIHWRRLLRPARYGVCGLTSSSKPWISSGVRLATNPFCKIADRIAARHTSSPFRLTKSHLHGGELDAETLLRCLNDFSKGYSLKAEYTLDSLRWLLSFMERARSRGNLRKIVVRDDSGKVVGWYIYYVNPRAVGEVVQVGGNPKCTMDVLDHLFCDAWEQGMTGLHGVVDRRRVPDFSDKGCFFTCRGGWTLARSDKPELLKLLDYGDALFSRLDGEWCLDPGH
jgi:hypothetical protein